MEKDIISTQIRLPSPMHDYIGTEAARMGIAKNAFLLILLELGKKDWENRVIPDEDREVR